MTGPPFPDVPGHGVHDKKINSFILLDKFEYQDADNGSALAWDAKGWIGGDVDRLWLRSEGERTNGVTKTLNFRLCGDTPSVHGGMSSPVFDKISNAGHLKPGERSVFGMALYNFEAEATAYIGENGQTAARFEGDYDILLTNGLILQPTAEVNLYGKNDPQRGIGSGLANTELGLRLRYEITRQFAPTLVLAGIAHTVRRLTWPAMMGKKQTRPNL